MTNLDIIALVMTLVCVISFAIIFTLLYRSYAKSTISQTQGGKRDIELIDQALIERSAKYQKRQKVASAVKSTLFVVCMAILIPLFIFSLYDRFFGKPLFGKSLMAVASGSMSFQHQNNTYLKSYGLDDQFQTFDMIVLEKVDSVSDLKIYDVIAFKDDTGRTIIHRIIKVENSNGKITFETRGDANEGSDKFHPAFDNVLGRYTGKNIPLLGMPICFLQSASGIATVTALFYVIFMIDSVSKKIDKIERERIDELLNVIESHDGDGEIHAVFKETIYYKGFAYVFDENGFVEKSEMQGQEAALDDDSMLKVLEQGDNKTSKEIKIETRKNDATGTDAGTAEKSS